MSDNIGIELVTLSENKKKRLDTQKEQITYNEAI